MVRKISSSRLILPGLMALIMAMVYYLFGSKFFLASMVLFLGGILALIDIRVGIFAITFMMPFLPNTLAAGAYLGLFIIYFFRRICIKDQPSQRSLYFGVIFVYLIVILIQTFTSYYVKGSLRDLFLHACGLLYLFVLVNSIKTKEDLNAFVTMLIFTVSIVALIGLLQVFTGVEISREWLDVENNPDIQVRVYSVFGNPNTLAEYLVFFTPLTISMFWHTKNLKKKIVFGLSSAVMMLTLVYTMSRGGWIGIAMAALVFCLLVDKRLLLLSIPLIFGALAFLPPTILNRILSIGNFADTSNAHRFNIWAITKDLIRDHKVAGVGFGYMPFKEVYETYSRTINSYHAHNTFLETISELGYLGFSVFISMLLTFVFYPISALVKSHKTGEDSFYKYIGVGVSAGLVGVFTHGLVENILYLPKIILAFWTLVALGATAINVYKLTKPLVVSERDQVYKIYRGSEIDG
ncbi:O-antigen ligase family protein [Neofamilia massiliensis]|uniref:O-antigen ligase family protein n=1 Tax=Neofamilia massiliensis TaxID=1673724 RepID=UPI0006BB8D9D|nr:O-antigen ligase family protein [Neofamilia massiliensis]